MIECSPLPFHGRCPAPGTPSFKEEDADKSVAGPCSARITGSWGGQGGEARAWEPAVPRHICERGGQGGVPRDLLTGEFLTVDGQMNSVMEALVESGKARWKLTACL